MINLKRFLPWIPEIYLILTTIAYWSMTCTLFNWIAIILILILIAQIKFGKKASGLIIATLFLLLNFYMCLALASELREFPSWTLEAERMLLFGSSYFCLNIIMSFWMLVKWGQKDALIAYLLIFLHLTIIIF